MENKKTSKVMIAVPTVDGWIHSRLVRSIIGQMAGRPLNIVAGVVPLEMARNRIVDGFLEHDATHLFMVDADTIPPEDAIERLLALDADIATAITPIVNRGGMTSNVFTTEDEEGAPDSWEDALNATKPYYITGVGLACVLIKREVFEKLEKPIFTSVWFQNGKFVEGDIHFCGKARDAGFKIMCDPSIVCEHVKQVTI